MRWRPGPQQGIRDERDAIVHRRLAELKEQLKDSRAEQKADAAAYASKLEAQQVTVHSALTVVQLCTTYTRRSPLTQMHPETSRLVRRISPIFCSAQGVHIKMLLSKPSTTASGYAGAVVWCAGPPQRPAGSK